MTLPPCPMCRTNRHVSTHGREEFYCDKCKGRFDSNPDEGGNYKSDPVRNAESKEEFRIRQQQRKGR